MESGTREVNTHVHGTHPGTGVDWTAAERGKRVGRTVESVIQG